MEIKRQTLLLIGQEVKEELEELDTVPEAEEAEEAPGLDLKGKKHKAELAAQEHPECAS